VIKYLLQHNTNRDYNFATLSYNFYLLSQVEKNLCSVFKQIYFFIIFEFLAQIEIYEKSYK